MGLVHPGAGVAVGVDRQAAEAARRPTGGDPLSAVAHERGDLGPAELDLHRCAVASLGLVRELLQHDHYAVSRLVVGDAAGPDGPQLLSSEEHTSELQSLMRISYAVFCL